MNERKLLLDIQDLTIHYETEAGRVRAVEHLYLELGYGETLGFVGETGAGKTTTARIFATGPTRIGRMIPSRPASSGPSSAVRSQGWATAQGIGLSCPETRRISAS